MLEHRGRLPSAAHVPVLANPNQQSRLVVTKRHLPFYFGFEVIHEGPLAGMRTEKSDVSSAGEGVEVGLKFSKEFGIEVGDKVVCFRTFQVEQEVNWDLGF